MHVQINSDNQTPVDASAADQLETLVRGKLDRISDRITRVELHVGDVNGPRRGPDISCTIELRPNGMKPLSASADAPASRRPRLRLRTKRFRLTTS